MRIVSRVLVLLALLSVGTSDASAQFRVDVEGGAVTGLYNDVRIPGDGGTLFSLVDDLSTDPGPFYRLRLEYTFSGRHTVSALYAPLTLTAGGTAPVDIVYEDETFIEGSKLDGSYTFNSYRLTYRYEFSPRGRWSYGLGFTAKIRDAAIKIESGGQVAEKTNVGFVPLVNFRVRYDVTDRIAVSLEGDALAAPQGRAEDVMLALHYRVSDAADLRAGYRFVEGGADNDEVYNFAFLSYASVGLTVSF
jgi:hypothetical protein